MAINGVNMSGYYSCYSTISQIRLQQALSRNPQVNKAVTPVDNVKKVTDNFKNSSMDFLKSYNAQMSDVMESANSLHDINSGSVMNNLDVTSSNTSVSEVSVHYRMREEKAIELDVSQLAGAQHNSSDLAAGNRTAEDAMAFTISGNPGGFSDIQVNVDAKNEDGSARTNRQMLKEAALQINQAKSGVKASLVEEEGKISLKLDGVETGTQASFTVSGNLGPAAGLDNVAVSAQNAVYSVKEGTSERSLTSQSNDIRLDLGRIDAKLKGTGSTTITSGVKDEAIISAVQDLADNYNSALKFMDANAGHGQGVINQIGNFVRDLAPDKTMQMLGLTTGKDGTLTLDKDVLANSLQKDPKLVKDAISGQYGLAQKTFDRAMTAMREKSGSLLSSDLQEAKQWNYSNPIDFMNIYSKNGSKNLNNFYALGLMVNYLV